MFTCCTDMIQQESRVIVADNSGAKTAKVIRVLKWTNSKTAWIGDKVVVAIKTVLPSWSIEKWSVQRGVVVRVRKEISRKDWTYVRFSDNAIALINKTLDPIWKRIFWPVAWELRSMWFKKIATMAEEVV